MKVYSLRDFILPFTLGLANCLSSFCALTSIFTQIKVAVYHKLKACLTLFYLAKKCTTSRWTLTSTSIIVAKALISIIWDAITSLYSPLMRIGRLDRSSYENISFHQFPYWYAMVCLFDLIFLVYACNNSTEMVYACNNSTQFGCMIISWKTPPSHLPLLCLIVVQFICKETSNFPTAMWVHNVLIKNRKRKEISLASRNMVMLNKTKMKSVGEMLVVFEIKAGRNHQCWTWKEKGDFRRMDDTEFVGKLKK